uniref:Uncharacterized protein n=1 Tax=Rhizophora mucronata TaxID=61149 RepID=A0A2P2QYN8_RHIMU
MLELYCTVIFLPPSLKTCQTQQTIYQPIVLFTASDTLFSFIRSYGHVDFTRCYLLYVI